MKNLYNSSLLLSLIILCRINDIQARVITLSNNVLSAGQYASFADAQTAANVDDTIYITPSPTSYGDITIIKRLTIIGGGYFVTGTQFNNNSRVERVYLNNNFPNTILSGLRIQGLSMASLNRTTYNTGNTNGVTIERCAITDLYIQGNNWIVKNSAIGDVEITSYYFAPNQNIIISNNFVSGQIYQSTCCTNANNPTLLVLNNIFHNYGRVGNIDYATFANNIFYFNQTAYADPNGGCNNCTFNYNITYSTLTPYTVLPSASNFGGNNLNNTNPQFRGTQYGASNYANATALAFYTNNWRLTTPILGSDGKEIGIYGGFYPPANTGGMPAIPQMQVLNINNAVVPQGGTLNVSFKARKQN